MKAFFVLACFFVAAQGMTWEQFKSVHNKSYGAEEETARKTIFEENMKKINEHNARFALGEVSYTLAMNNRGDKTMEELKKLNGHKNVRSNNPLHQVTGRAPASMDWNSKGAVTPIKDQGQCGSCWSFSTTGSLEGQNFIKNGKLISLSEQQLVDCSGSYGNEGCNGGLMDQAFQYVKAKGLELESTYSYTAQDGSCRYKADKVALSTIKSFVDVASGEESALKDAVGTVGPISVAIDASNFSFQFYSGGVYNEPSCSSTSLDHGVLAVGYGTDNGSDFWLVKNSWGSSWGLNGFIKMSRNVQNQCGIATQASYPVLA